MHICACHLFHNKVKCIQNVSGGIINHVANTQCHQVRMSSSNKLNSVNLEMYLCTIPRKLVFPCGIRSKCAKSPAKNNNQNLIRNNPPNLSPNLQYTIPSDGGSSYDSPCRTRVMSKWACRSVWCSSMLQYCYRANRNQ